MVSSLWANILERVYVWKGLFYFRDAAILLSFVSSSDKTIGLYKVVIWNFCIGYSLKWQMPFCQSEPQFELPRFYCTILPGLRRISKSSEVDPKTFKDFWSWPDYFRKLPKLTQIEFRSWPEDFRWFPKHWSKDFWSWTEIFQEVNYSEGEPIIYIACRSESSFCWEYYEKKIARPSYTICVNRYSCCFESSQIAFALGLVQFVLFKPK